MAERTFRTLDLNPSALLIFFSCFESPSIVLKISYLPCPLYLETDLSFGPFPLAGFPPFLLPNVVLVGNPIDFTFAIFIYFFYPQDAAIVITPPTIDIYPGTLPGRVTAYSPSGTSVVPEASDQT